MVKTNNLRVIRASKEMTQAQFAKAVGISLTSYRLKEEGKVKFSLVEAKKIADFLNVSIEEIFFN